MQLSNIVVLAGLVIVAISGISSAANRNPWTLYQQNSPYAGSTGSVNPPQGLPRAAWQVPNPMQPPAVQPYGNQYAPLPGQQRPNPGQGWNRQMPTVPQQRYYRQPFAVSPGFNIPFQGGYGGQFGFGMNFAPNFGYPGMPNGYGFQGMPFGGYMPWGSGFPMF